MLKIIKTTICIFIRKRGVFKLNLYILGLFETKRRSFMRLKPLNARFWALLRQIQGLRLEKTEHPQ
jgi:hypothetical protein